jgi:hypothetical protein
MFTGSNNFSEGQTSALLLLNEGSFSPLHINIWFLALVHIAISICMEKGPKTIIIRFILHIIAFELSLFRDRALVLLPTVNMLSLMLPLASTGEWIFKGTSSSVGSGVYTWGGAFNIRHRLMGRLLLPLSPCSESASRMDLCFFATALRGLCSDMFLRRRTSG